MLINIKLLYGNKLSALDGDIGQVNDFYFDDRNWAVRYTVVNTGTWLLDRLVLISPHAFGSIYTAGKTLLVNLTKKQIAGSPIADTHKTVSRQYEEEYHRYYGWPYYWEGDGLWGGMRDFPILQVPPKFASVVPLPLTSSKLTHTDAHLRSALSVHGYHIKTSDATIVGSVCDFLMDDRSWAIQWLLVKVGNRFTGREVRVSIEKVIQVSYQESTITVNLTKAEVDES